MKSTSHTRNSESPQPVIRKVSLTMVKSHICKTKKECRLLYLWRSTCQTVKISLQGSCAQPRWQWNVHYSSPRFWALHPGKRKQGNDVHPEWGNVPLWWILYVHGDDTILALPPHPKRSVWSPIGNGSWKWHYEHRDLCDAFPHTILCLA